MLHLNHQSGMTANLVRGLDRLHDQTRRAGRANRHDETVDRLLAALSG